MIGLPTHPEPFMTRQELAKLMGVSTATVDRLRRQGMPSVVWGAKSRRFRPSTALAWAQSRPLHSHYVNGPAAVHVPEARHHEGGRSAA